MSEIKDNLRRIRKEKKMTQQQLADQIGVNVYAIKSWESGRYEPTTKNAFEVAKVLGVTMDELLGHNLEEPSLDFIVEHSPGRTAFIDEVMTMPEERFRRILKYSEFLKKEDERNS